ncbi:MAG: hypothetical protein [Bacteriophage sp.]|nr:MAG: hypothetical protein [Bacteriophage sp.]
MSMSNFHWRSAVFSAARNMALIVRPGVLKSWFVVLGKGDLFLHGGEIVRCDGVNRTRDGFNIIVWDSIDGSTSGSLIAGEQDRVEKLDIIGYSDVRRFLAGTQPQFIADVELAYRGYHPTMPMTNAEREAQRRSSETPEQSEERRRKNRDNMRRKRAMNRKGLI